MKRIITCAALIAFATLYTSPLHAQSPTVPSDADIRQILADRIDRDRQSVGIVVGVIDAREAGHRRVITYGSLEKGDSRPLNADTMFEIGSVTKVFTSLLLADMVQRREVALTDPVAKYLPADVKMPERNGRAITLQDLATHTSGLPRLPTNFTPKDPANPYADYSVAQLYQFLSTYTLPYDIGSRYDYSNLGGGLLGHVLARHAGMDYEALVRSRITGPLGMTSTSVTLSADQQRRLAVGHNDRLASVLNWDLPTLAGGGALRSTANDMLTFVAANLGATPSPLVSAMSAMLTDRRPTGMPGLDWRSVGTFSRGTMTTSFGTTAAPEDTAVSLDSAPGRRSASSCFRIRARRRASTTSGCTSWTRDFPRCNRRSHTPKSLSIRIYSMAMWARISSRRTSC